MIKSRISHDLNCLSQIIDASQSVEDVHKNIANHTHNAINTAQNMPLGQLWTRT